MWDKVTAWCLSVPGEPRAMTATTHIEVNLYRNSDVEFTRYRWIEEYEDCCRCLLGHQDGGAKDAISSDEGF